MNRYCRSYAPRRRGGAKEFLAGVGGVRAGVEDPGQHGAEHTEHGAADEKRGGADRRERDAHNERAERGDGGGPGDGPAAFFIGCAVFCVFCTVLAWVFYARPNAPYPG